MKLETKQGVLIIAAVAIIAIIGIVYFVWKPGSSGTTNHGPAAVFAPKGQLVQGFPQSLILDNGAKFSNSYTINYSSSLSQYTAEWNSSSSMVSLFNTYASYVLKNNWQIIHLNSNTSTVMRGFYATSGSSTLSLVIFAEGNGSQVTLSYSTP